MGDRGVGVEGWGGGVEGVGWVDSMHSALR